MTTFLIVLSSVITVTAAIPYIVEILRGKAKPRVASWLTWAVLTGIACAAAFVDGQVPTGVLLLIATIGTALIAILGLKYGDHHFEKLDWWCLAGAGVGLLLWWIFNSPEVAVIAAVTIDLIGAIPTFKHSWLKPHEETWITFALSGLGAGITLAISGEWAITATAYPLYLVVANFALAACILASPNRKLAAEPAELRKL